MIANMVIIETFFISAVPVIIGTLFIALFLHWVILVRQQKEINSPGIPLPVFGHSLYFWKADPRYMLQVLQNFMEKEKSKRKMIIHVFGNKNMFWAYHPETVAPIFQNSTEFLGRERAYVDFLKPWLGNGLFLSSGNQWHTRRKILTPAYRSLMLEDSLTIFNSKADVLCDIIFRDFTGNASGKDLFPYIQRCTLDIILQSAIGLEMDIQNKTKLPYATAIENLKKIIFLRSFNSWRNPCNLFHWFSKYRKELGNNLKLVHEFIDSIISIRRQQITNDSEESGVNEKEKIKIKTKSVLLDILLNYELEKEENSPTDIDIRGEINTFLIAGHDTTSVSIAWTLLLLGHHPEVQEKVYDEQSEVFGEMRYSDDVEKTHLSKMKYLKACIRESRRLYPPIPFITRKVERELSVDGFTVRKGQTYGIFIYYLHRNPDIWDNPNEFIPERFLEDSEIEPQKRHRYAYLPFSAGIRNCIGQKFAQMEELAVLSKVLRKYRVESIGNLDDTKLIFEIVSRPQNGINLKLHLR